MRKFIYSILAAIIVLLPASAYILSIRQFILSPKFYLAIVPFITLLVYYSMVKMLSKSFEDVAKQNPIAIALTYFTPIASGFVLIILHFYEKQPFYAILNIVGLLALLVNLFYKTVHESKTIKNFKE